MSDVEMDKYERELSERYGLKVTVDATGHYIVTDPQMPRKQNKYIGGNLYALMLRAIDERSRAKNKIHEFTPPPAKEKAISTQAVIIPLLPSGKRASYEIKKMIYQNRTISVNQILAGLDRLGVPSTRSTVASMRSNFLNDLIVLEEVRALIR
jgi:hypothetical protein